MAASKRKGVLWRLLRAPVHLYRWRLGWLLGHRCLLLTHIGRRTGVQRQAVLEVVEYRKEGPEVVVVNGFGPDSDWLRNIEARGGEEVVVGPQRFVAAHRFLGEEEAMRVIQCYEHRNRFIAPIVRIGLSWLLGWQYRGGENDRQRLVRQLPLIAFRPRDSQAQKIGTRYAAAIVRTGAPYARGGPSARLGGDNNDDPRPSRELTRWQIAFLVASVIAIIAIAVLLTGVP